MEDMIVECFLHAPSAGTIFFQTLGKRNQITLESFNLECNARTSIRDNPLISNRLIPELEKNYANDL